MKEFLSLIHTLEELQQMGLADCVYRDPHTANQDRWALSAFGIWLVERHLITEFCDGDNKFQDALREEYIVYIMEQGWL